MTMHNNNDTQIDEVGRAAELVQELRDALGEDAIALIADKTQLAACDVPTAEQCKKNTLAVLSMHCNAIKDEDDGTWETLTREDYIDGMNHAFEMLVSSAITSGCPRAALHANVARSIQSAEVVALSRIAAAMQNKRLTEVQIGDLEALVETLRQLNASESADD